MQGKAAGIAAAFMAAMLVFPVAVLSSQTAGAVTVRIRGDLARSRTQEFFFVTLENTVRLLVLDRDNPSGEADYQLPGPGRYLCFIHSLSYFGTTGTAALGHGALELTVEGGEVYSLSPDFSRFDDRGSYLIGLEPSGTIRGGPGMNSLPGTRTPGSAGAGTAYRGTAVRPALPGSGPARALPAVPPNRWDDTPAGDRLRDLEVRISEMEAELSKLEMFMSFYNSLSPSTTAPGEFNPMLSAPWSFGMGGTSPSPLEGYRQYLQIMKDELDRLKQGEP